MLFYVYLFTYLVLYTSMLQKLFLFQLKVRLFKLKKIGNTVALKQVDPKIHRCVNEGKSS